MDKIFPYNSDAESQFSKAKKLFNASMNGITSEGMSALGYKLNFGVALPRIKEISLRFASNRLLAQRGWWSGIREMMIFATFNLEKDLNITPFSLSELDEWCDRISNLELCEQFSKNFLSKIIPDNNSPILSEDFSSYLIKKENRNEYHAALGYINLSNLMLQGETLKQKKFFLEKMEEDASSPLYNIYATVSRCAKMLARKDPETAKEFLKKIEDKEGAGIRLICDEINTELSYFLI